MTTSWIQEITKEFIELYKSEPVLWDPNHQHAKSMLRRTQAWERIQSRLGIECSISELKAKRESLMAQYRLNIKKIKDHASKGEMFVPQWFAFDQMNTFLGQFYHEGEIKNYNDEDTEIDVNESLVISKFEPEDEESVIEYLIEDEDIINTETLKLIKARSPIKKRPLVKKRPKTEFVSPAVTNTLPLDNIEQETYQAHEEDECDLFGRLLAKKLKRFGEKDRDLVMMEIDNIIFRTKMRIAQVKNGENAT